MSDFALFTAEQANEVTSGPGYATPRAPTGAELDSRRAPRSRDTVLAMLAAGASLEDIARAGGKMPSASVETFRAAAPPESGTSWMLIGAGALAVVGVVAVVVMRRKKGRR